MVFAILASVHIIEADVYAEKLDAAFSASAETDDDFAVLLHLEWEPNIDHAIAYALLHIKYTSFNDNLFGRLLMNQLKQYYHKQPNIKEFASKMYPLWQKLPPHMQNKEPFYGLSYADDPLS